MSESELKQPKCIISRDGISYGLVDELFVNCCNEWMARHFFSLAENMQIFVLRPSSQDSVPMSIGFKVDSHVIVPGLRMKVDSSRCAAQGFLRTCSRHTL